MKLVTAIASILIILGAINWGLYGLLELDLVDKYFGGLKKPSGKLIYILIGLAGVYSLLYIIFV